MRVSQENSVDFGSLYWERVPIFQSKIFKTLKKSAINKDILVVMRQEIFGSCDRLDTAQKLNIERHGLRCLYQKNTKNVDLNQCFNDSKG